MAQTLISSTTCPYPPDLQTPPPEPTIKKLQDCTTYHEPKTNKGIYTTLTTITYVFIHVFEHTGNWIIQKLKMFSSWSTIKTALLWISRTPTFDKLKRMQDLGMEFKTRFKNWHIRALKLRFGKNYQALIYFKIGNNFKYSTKCIFLFNIWYRGPTVLFWGMVKREIGRSNEPSLILLLEWDNGQVW